MILITGNKRTSIQAYHTIRNATEDQLRTIRFCSDSNNEILCYLRGQGSVPATKNFIPNSRGMLFRWMRTLNSLGFNGYRLIG